jgi:serine/threonine protein kinase
VPQPAQPGRVIGGRYQLVKELGSGGFGRVWQARDEMLHADVAIKEVWLPPTLSQAERQERLARAEREARNAAKLRDHPHVVAVHDVLIEDDTPWIVMRLVVGRSLQKRVESDGPVSVDQATRIAAALLSALGAAHAAGIVHRDVKPANVMLVDGLVSGVLLTDFGIAVHKADPSLTASHMVVGSAEYSAPERLRGQDGQAANDLFSLGATLYFAVEGISPFHRATIPATLTAILTEDPPPTGRAGRLAPLITGLLNKNAAERPTIAQAQAMLNLPPAPPPKPPTRQLPQPPPWTPPTTPPWTPPRSPARRNAAVVGILSVVALLMLVVIVEGPQILRHISSLSSSSSPNSDGTTAFEPTSTETTEPEPTSDPTIAASTTTAPTTDPTTDVTTTTAQPTDDPTSGLTYAENDLLSRVRPWVLEGCQVGRSAETGGIVAAAFCQPTQSGPSANVGVFEFADSNAVQQALSHADAQTINTDDCASGQFIGTWNYNGYALGQMVCLMVNGYLHIEWSFSDPPVLVAAEGSAGPSGLVSWWRNNANCVNTN